MVFLKKVEDASRYGVPEFLDNRVRKIVEKPALIDQLMKEGVDWVVHFAAESHVSPGSLWRKSFNIIMEPKLY
jgi:dTDP-D-glucose 4,6-dehydratase